jgi:hypothetical protein
VTIDAHAFTGHKMGSLVRHAVRRCMSSPFFWSLKVMVTVSQSSRRTLHSEVLTIFSLLILCITHTIDVIRFTSWPFSFDDVIRFKSWPFS